MIDVPETHHHKSERGRLTTRGRSTDDGSTTTLLVVHEVDGSWTIHGLGAGVTLPAVDMAAAGLGDPGACSVSGNGRAVVRVETDPVSAPLPEGVSHLLIVDDALSEGRWGAHITLCGLEVRRPNVEPDDVLGCCPGMRYCPECVREAIRQTSCAPRVEAWACDRCDTRWAITVVSPRPLLDRTAVAVAERSAAEQAIALAALLIRDGVGEAGPVRADGVDQVAPR